MISVSERFKGWEIKSRVAVSSQHLDSASEGTQDSSKPWVTFRFSEGAFSGNWIMFDKQRREASVISNQKRVDKLWRSSFIRREDCIISTEVFVLSCIGEWCDQRNITKTPGTDFSISRHGFWTSNHVRAYRQGKLGPAPGNLTIIQSILKLFEKVTAEIVVGQCWCQTGRCDASQI